MRAANIPRSCRAASSSASRWPERWRLRRGLLLLDEPLSALDALERMRLRGEIRRLQQQLGITTILVTHDQEEALSMADRIVVMNHGDIEQIGTPTEIYRRPGLALRRRFRGQGQRAAARALGGGRCGSAAGAAVRMRGNGGSRRAKPCGCICRPEDRGAARRERPATPNRRRGAREGRIPRQFCGSTFRVSGLEGQSLHHADFSLQRAHGLGVRAGAAHRVALRANGYACSRAGKAGASRRALQSPTPGGVAPSSRRRLELSRDDLIARGATGRGACRSWCCSSWRRWRPSS